MDAVGTGPDRPAESPPRGPRAVAGGAGVAVALGTAELVAGLLPGAASPVVAVGDAVIDRVPPAVKDAAISLFGTADKIALIAGVLVLSALVGAAAGLLARRSLLLPAAIFAAFATLGTAAAAGDPQASVATSAVATWAGAVLGLAVVRLLLQRRSVGAGGTVSRRRFLQLAGGALAIAGAAAWSGRALRTRTVATVSRQRLDIPAPARTAPPLAAGVDLDVAGVAPFRTPNDTFYRIDTALSVPRVDAETWRLHVTGMVDRPLEWSFDELVGRGLREHWTTLCCVSNEVGGRLIGNALWAGIPLADMLNEAGVHVGATQIVGRSVDGWTAGFPTDVAFDGRAAMVAVQMNGEPLPIEHGFPARLVVPGLYGYVSATKWLSEIELTTWEGYDAYWVPRGWSKEGPVKTQSRIDAPRSGSVTEGRVAVAGVAWAQGRGIERVEVQVDEGEWHEARLAAVPNVDTWRQWVWEWDATPGSYILRVRATDSDGETQTEQRQPPAPDGATGHHHVVLQVLSADAVSG